jgi:predicted permease
MATVFRDIRFAIRLLAKDKSFAVTTLLTLAICIGANTAMFSIVRSVLFKPLPFPGSERVVLLYNSYPNAGAPRVGAAVPDYYDREAAVPALDEPALFRQEGMTFGDENGAQRLTTLRATPSFFRLVQAQPVLGRIFTDDEDQPGKDAKALLSYGFWQRALGGQPSAVGRSIRLNGRAFDVVGVLPPAFTFLQNDIDLFVPAAFAPADKADDRRHSNNWQMVGRLKTGATIEQVRQQVDALNAKNDDRFPEFRQVLKDARFHTVVVLLQDDVVRDVRAMLYLLWGGVLFVLVIGCVNIANLVIVRASGRSREMATRHAIGGDLTRLARQLFTETTLLALVGAAVGVLLGWWAIRSVAALNLDQLPRGYEISVDRVTIAVIAALTMAVGALIGLAPVLRLWRMDLNIELREDGRGGTSGRRANLIRRVLAMAQVAIALVLLIGAGLLLASFRAVLRLDLGFQPENVATAAVNLPATSYKDAPALVTFEQRALQAIRAIPEVEAAGSTSLLPFSGNINANVIMAEGYVMKPGESLLAPSTAFVSAGYFEAMHVQLVRGRLFDERDTATAPKTIIVDNRLARKFWPDRDPVGRRMYTPTDPKDLFKITPETQFLTVVGVIKEVQLTDPRADFTPIGTCYFPFEQLAGASRSLTLVVKTRTASSTIANSVRSRIASLDPQLPVFRARSMQAWIDLALVGRRGFMLIALAFGVVALLLSAVGIYGVLAYTVSQRRREIGVRMALGSTAGRVFTLVLGEGLRILTIGLGVGLTLSVLVGQLMKNQLFSVAPLSPVVITLVTLALSVVALVASTIPAWRASRVNPVAVLTP